MFDSLRSLFMRKKSRSEHENIIKVGMDGKELLVLIRECAVSTFQLSHMYCRKYLLPFIDPLNEQLRRQMDVRISSINQKRYSTGHMAQVLERQIAERDGFVWLILDLWYPFMVAEIGNAQDPIKFLRVETHLLLQMLLSVLKQIYQKQAISNPEQDGDINSRKFRVALIEVVTESYQFKKIKTIFIKNCKKGLGVNGVFTPSQVELTTSQLNQLMRFKQIPAPFHESIGLMLDFYAEYRITRKVKKLVEAVGKAKQEIIEYRNFFGMGSTVLGSDQVMPIINFICQKTGKNIFASIQYIRALLGGGKGYYNLEQCVNNLKLMGSDADYCVDLVQSMSTIYCHASQICR